MRLGRFFCSDEKSKKVIKEARNNPNKRKEDRKFLAKVAAIISAVTIFAGFTYAHFTSEPTHNNNTPQHAQVELGDTQHFDAFMSKSLDTFKDLNPIVKKYNQLHESNPFSFEFRDMIETMNKNGKTVESLALANVKAKFADLFNTTPDHISLDVNTRDGKYSVIQTKYDDKLNTYQDIIYSSNDTDKSNISQTVFAIANVQSSFDKDSVIDQYSRSKDYYDLHIKNIDTAKCDYVLQNGKIVELPPIKSHDKAISQAKTSKTKKIDNAKNIAYEPEI